MINGVPKTVNNYRNWRADLIRRIDNYCAFCNIALTDSIQVEHVIAQNIDPALQFEWDNMLLACGPCNRAKSNKPCPPNTHYLPQFHNTHLAFTATAPVAHQIHLSDMCVFLGIRNGPALQEKAQRTIELCKLDRDTTQNADQVTDLRWKFRYETFISALYWRTQWDQWGHERANAFLELLITVAKSTGFWSVWFDIFQDVRQVRQALVEQFPGTARNCFDDGFIPVTRNPGDPI